MHRLWKNSAGAALLLLSATAAVANPVDWERLAQQPGGLSAVATAITMLGKCSTKFEFEERLDDDKLSITVLCPDTGDGAGAIIVEFERFDGTRFLVQKFNFAG